MRIYNHIVVFLHVQKHGPNNSDVVMKKRYNINTAGRMNENGHVTKEVESWRKQKLVEIHQAFNSDPVDVGALRRAAVSAGGLLTNELRRKVWPKLLNINVYDLPHKPGRDVRENHKDYNQILLDVRRSMKRFPKGMPVTQRAVLQEQLTDIMLEVLKRNPQLHYYQGYHDVAVTLLLVVGERTAIAMLHTLSTHHLRDFMDPTMDSTKHILNYLMPILEQVDGELHDFLFRAEVGTIFALSWLITWYGHVLSEFRHTLRLYDFFLASHPLMPIYLAATIVLHREKEVKKTECDMAMVHHLLSRIPQDLPYEHLIGRSQALFDQYPPSLLAKRAALQCRKSLSISTYQSFQLSTLRQRPDSVLRQLNKDKGSSASTRGLSDSAWHHGNRMVKVALWGLSATVGAAVFAVAQSAMDWGPEVLLQLF